MDKRNLLPQVARLRKQSEVKRVESEHHRDLAANADLALGAGFGWAELSVSSSSTKITERSQSVELEHIGEWSLMRFRH